MSDTPTSETPARNDSSTPERQKSRLYPADPNLDVVEKEYVYLINREKRLHNNELVLRLEKGLEEYRILYKDSKG